MPGSRCEPSGVFRCCAPGRF